MADIDNAESAADFRAKIASLDAPELMAQALVQQGAIHALRTLVKTGCTLSNALEMIESLEKCDRLIEAEKEGRQRAAAKPGVHREH